MRRVCLSFLGVLFLAGCTSVDYVGQRFDPSPDYKIIEYYTKPGDVPPDQYKIMGRMTVTYPNEVGRFRVREKLESLAQEYGADAVLLIEIKKVETAVYDLPAPQPGVQPSAPTFTSPDPPPQDESGVDTKLNPFNERTKLQGEVGRQVHTVAQSIFLKNSAELRKLMIERKQPLTEFDKIKDFNASGGAPAETDADDNSDLEQMLEKK